MIPGSTKRALLIATTWWAGPAKLAVALSQQGWYLEAISPKDHPFRYVSKITKRYSYAYRDPVASLRQAVQSGNPDLLVPCDDAAVLLLHRLHSLLPECRPLIEHSIGPAFSFPTVSSRLLLMQLAKDLDIRTPETAGLRHTEELRSWFDRHDQSHVLKRDGTFGGKGVAVVHTLSEAERAFESISKGPSLANRVSRWLALGDPLAFWNAKEHQAELIVQRFVQGRPSNILFVCEQGSIRASLSVEVLLTEGITGAALVARTIEHPEMLLAAEKIAQTLGLSGFHGLDFILEAETDRAYLIEMNPRCTQLGHIPIDGQGDLARFLGPITAITHESYPSIPRSQIVAFFPQSLWSLREPVMNCPIYIDVPWMEPALVRELMKRDWRERRLLGSLYARLFRRKRAAVAWSDKLTHSATPVMSGNGLLAD